MGFVDRESLLHKWEEVSSVGPQSRDSRLGATRGRNEAPQKSGIQLVEIASYTMVGLDTISEKVFTAVLQIRKCASVDFEGGVGNEVRVINFKWLKKN